MSKSNAVFGMLLLLTSCIRSLDFALVDQATLKPVQGVTVRLYAQRLNILLPSREERREIGHTSEGGYISVPGIRTFGNWTTTVSFQKQGFYAGKFVYSDTRASDLTSDPIVLRIERVPSSLPDK